VTRAEHMVSEFERLHHELISERDEANVSLGVLFEKASHIAAEADRYKNALQFLQDHKKVPDWIYLFVKTALVINKNDDLDLQDINK
jgi:hypothetical protein